MPHHKDIQYNIITISIIFQDNKSPGRLAERLETDRANEGETIHDVDEIIDKNVVIILIFFSCTY